MRGAGSAPQTGGPPEANFFDRIIGAHKPRLRATPMRIEPKTFFANERTFLHWLHMAVTVGSISAALLGFASTAERCAPPLLQAISHRPCCTCTVWTPHACRAGVKTHTCTTAQVG